MTDVQDRPTVHDDLAALLDGDLADLDDEQLAARLADLEDAFDRLHDTGSRDLTALTALADRIDAARAEQSGRGSRLAELVDRVHPPQPPDVDPEPAVEGEPATVTANGNGHIRPSLAAVSQRAPRPALPSTRPAVTITAAANDSLRLTLDEVAAKLHEAARPLRTLGDTKPVRVARIEVPYPPGQTLGSDLSTNVRLIRSTVGQPEAAALVAAGGWCAPSEPVFRLFDIGPDLDGLIDLPSLRARAGALIPSYFGIGDVDGALWTWTEDDDIAAADNDGSPTDKVKPCLRIPCPSWTECRLEAEGLCVTHGNLSDQAFPELTRDFLRVVMAPHAHRVSASKIAKIVATATTVTPAAAMAVSDAAGDLLGVIALAAADLRSQYRLSRRRAIEVGLPDWALDVLRSNVAMRAGVDLLGVTDAQVTAWLTARGIRPQFLADLDPLSTSATPVTGWPASVRFLIWPSGSYVTLDGGSIDLGVVRDSTLNASNDHTAAWSEQFLQVCARGPAARIYSVGLDVTGVTACCPPAA